MNFKLKTKHSTSLFSKITQIAYGLNAIYLGGHAEAHKKGFREAKTQVRQCLGLEYFKAEGNNDAYLLQTQAPLPQFKKLVVLSGAELKKRQDACKDVADWSGFGINTKDKQFKARAVLKATVKKSSNKKELGRMTKKELLALLQGAK